MESGTKKVYTYGAKLCVVLLLFYLKVSTALLCYSCADISDTEQCLNVTECPDHHVCFGRADGFDSAVVTHTLGCKSIEGAATTNEPGRTTFCDHVCNTDLCNLHQCALFNKNISRHPRCLSCQHVDDPVKCHTVKVCGQNQVCAIHKFSSFGQARYRMGCVEKTFCNHQGDANPAIVAVGRRTSSPPCSTCCTQDNCNLYVCTDKHRDAGEMSALKLINHTDCSDSKPDICSSFGALSVDSCKMTTVLRSCRSSCDVCGQVAWSGWQAWSGCSATCGRSGVQTRHRQCIRQLEVLQSIECPGAEVDTQPCSGLPDCSRTVRPPAITLSSLTTTTEIFTATAGTVALTSFTSPTPKLNTSTIYSTSTSKASFSTLPYKSSTSDTSTVRLLNSTTSVSQMPTTTAPTSTSTASTSSASSTRITKVKATTLPTTASESPTNFRTANTSSTTSLSASTTKTPPSTTPQSISCKVCKPNLPDAYCESYYEEQTCTYPNNYCINHVINSANGKRVVTRRCGNRDTCVRDWYQGTSDNGNCTNYDPKFRVMLDFECTFCCISDNCNQPVVPFWQTMFRD